MRIPLQVHWNEAYSKEIESSVKINLANLCGRWEEKLQHGEVLFEAVKLIRLEDENSMIAVGKTRRQVLN